MSKQIEPHVLQFYEPKKLLGSGAYGHVWKVIDKKSRLIVALKKIFDAFQNSTDAQRTYREISLLHQMQHKNIIKLHKVIKSTNKRDLYLVFEYMESDLLSLVGESILTLTHTKFVLFQILKSLKYMHSAQLIHRDLKPSNILINSECQIKICDFGLARSLAHEQQQQNILSEEVATRWYRSPQMLLGSRDYGKPTDVWSVGCIVAELLIGQPIFPGDSTLNQIQKIIEFSGIPSKESLDSLKSQCAQNIINSFSVRRKSIKEIFRKCGKEHNQLINLTIKMLQFNPSKRPSVQQLLQSSIFSQFQSKINEQQQICLKFICPQIDDNMKLTLQQYRKIIYKDIERRYPQFNHQSHIKSIINPKKHKSFIQKNKLKQDFSSHSHSFIQKSKLKNFENYHSLNKNKSIVKNYSKNILQNHSDYLKNKFYKHSKANKLKQHQSINLIKQPVKSQFLRGINKACENFDQEKNSHYLSKIQTKAKNQLKQHKQNSLAKKNRAQQQEKASIYKNQLKFMKSFKNLTKKKIQKPKFDQTPLLKLLN